MIPENALMMGYATYQKYVLDNASALGFVKI